MGEKIPFCSEAKKKTDGEEVPEKKVKKFAYHTLYPNVRNTLSLIFQILPIWHKDPVWGVHVPTKKESEVFERKKEMVDEKYRTLSEKYLERNKKKNLNIELSETFNKIDKFRKIEKSFGKVKIKYIKLIR